MVDLIQDGVQGILMGDPMFVCTGRPDDPHRFIVLQYWPRCKTISVPPFSPDASADVSAGVSTTGLLGFAAAGVFAVVLLRLRPELLTLMYWFLATENTWI
ncbi:hypothetical protein GU243_10575 [Pseudarthrobacter psychrotolerans]|uniref:Uncharacterized protein n=1 Tax=Pseudarthrobacter psychrotolerans TaxID=2697569 RepID=A0A6P1NRE4_9MICC|nr:hypothetical protein [Pseudarthrobacter psychrotolerans]QHK20102.1 hypothetical protein GU243_10575 [Pseudarthrobacter psychrotolerans]